MKASLQPRTAESQETSRPLDSPYLTSQQALAYLNFRTLSALYSHIRENGLPYCRAGRALRFDRRELDVWLKQHRGPSLAAQRPTVTARAALRPVSPMKGKG